MLHPTKLSWTLTLLTCFAFSTALVACEEEKSDETEEKDDDDDGKKKKKGKKKKGKKKKDDDGDNKKASAESGNLPSNVAGRSKTLAWKSNDFDNDVAANDTFKTGSKTCNKVLNACMACRDRIKAKEGDMKLWSATVSECFSLKKAVLAIDDGKRDGKCTDAMKAMKAEKDCVKGSYSARGSIK